MASVLAANIVCDRRRRRSSWVIAHITKEMIAMAIRSDTRRSGAGQRAKPNTVSQNTQKKSNPWDIPPRPKFRAGDRKREPIYLAVGKGLSAWEGVETAIASLFAVVTSSDDAFHYIPAV